jgi:glycosyltransferase involved in cell wall biosynthesis
MRKTIAFVINSIGYGGAERVLHNILASIGDRREHYDVHLILLDDLPEARTMPAGITKHVLDSRGSLPRSIWLLFRCLARLRPALLVSFLVRANVASALSARMLGLPLIACERMHLSSHLAGRYRGAKLLATRWMPRLAYGGARIVLGVSTGVTEDLVEHFAVDPKRARTIYNPYDIETIRREAARTPEIALPDRFIVAAGRLERAKNFEQLIEAFLRANLPTSLVILGEGPERCALERLVASRQAGDRVFLPGYAANPFAIVARAEFYVSSSLNEGFPNAMVEAMVLGKPVVASDCHSGPAEILTGVVTLNCKEPVEAEYGILVPEGSVSALTKAMIRMTEPELRRHYAGQAAKRASDFDFATVTEQYWSLFESVAASDPS